MNNWFITTLLPVLCFICLGSNAAAGVGSAALPIHTGGENSVAEGVTAASLERFAEFYGADMSDGALGYKGIAERYRYWGERYEVRWDYAYFQMLLETGFLQFGAGVHRDHYNFAGIGATVTGKAGQTFSDLDTGVRAHIQHLAIYSLLWIPDEELVSDYTRKVQPWIFNIIGKQLGRAAGFDDLGEEYPGDAVAWSVGHPHYARSIELIAKRYQRWREIDEGLQLIALSDAAVPEFQLPTRAATTRRVAPRWRR